MLLHLNDCWYFVFENSYLSSCWYYSPSQIVSLHNNYIRINSFTSGKINNVHSYPFRFDDIQILFSISKYLKCLFSWIYCRIPTCGLHIYFIFTIFFSILSVKKLRFCHLFEEGTRGRLRAMYENILISSLLFDCDSVTLIYCQCSQEI